MTDANSFTKLVPGFDFLQGLVKNAGSALPNIGQWVAPTLNPEELEKRIEELRTVQFWLEQNARMLGATIQALEVQRMTLSTLKTMNVQMEDLRESLKIRMPGMPEEPSKAAATASAAQAAQQAASEALASAAAASANPPGTKDAKEPPPSPVDPLQWWNALTQQFTQLATTAMKDNAAAALNPALNPSFHPAGQGTRKAAAAPAGAARKTAGASAKAKPAARAKRAPTRP
jgi:hypothetical protein